MALIVNQYEDYSNIVGFVYFGANAAVGVYSTEEELVVRTLVEHSSRSIDFLQITKVRNGGNGEKLTKAE